MHEAQMHEANCFLTLTYDEEHLPYPPTIKIEDWQVFTKAVRKRFGKFRYFHCGEYGDKNGRPHYHAAIFGLDWFEDRLHTETTKGGDKLYESPALAKCWPQGLHAIAELTLESSAYIARYIMKKQTGDQAEKHYLWIDKTTGECFMLKPEYCSMSRRPGIGTTWIEKYLSDVYPRDQVISNGMPCKPPKFYDSFYEKIDPKGLQKIKALRAKDAKKHEWNHTYGRLIVREEVQTARIRNLRREI